MHALSCRTFLAKWFRFCHIWRKLNKLSVTYLWILNSHYMCNLLSLTNYFQLTTFRALYTSEYCGECPENSPLFLTSTPVKSPADAYTVGMSDDYSIDSFHEHYVNLQQILINDTVLPCCDAPPCYADLATTQFLRPKSFLNHPSIIKKFYLSSSRFRLKCTTTS
jgi:hypothetical protein